MGQKKFQIPKMNSFYEQKPLRPVSAPSDLKDWDQGGTVELAFGKCF